MRFSFLKGREAVNSKRSLRDVIVEVKTAYNIVDYMGSAGLRLSPNGVNKWKALCPFHKEKTPSFVVNESFQSYHCFGCGVHGDLISFVVEYENLQFMDALSKLAEDKNIELSVDSGSGGVDYRSLYAVLKDSANFFFNNFMKLPENHAAKMEISGRGLSFDGRNGVVYGYAPAGNLLLKFLRSKGYDDDVIVQSGVCGRSEKGDLYDFFRSRLMFIITDRYKKPIGFSSRKLFEDDRRGKYVNSVEGPLFHKSSVLYNHFLARKNSGKLGSVFVVEGQFDVAAFVEAGLPNVVASSGTAFTRDHMFECRKMVGNDGRVVFCFDGDDAGVHAAQQIFLRFPDEHTDSYVVVFPDGLDPCDFRQKFGNEKLKEIVENPVTLVEFMLQSIRKDYDLDSIVGRSNFIEQGASIVKVITNPTIREHCIRFLSSETLTPIDVIRETVNTVQPFKIEEDRVQAKSETQDDSASNISESVDNSDGSENSGSVDVVAKLQKYVEKDMLYDYAVRYINLGLLRPKWRESLINTHYREHILPKVFDPFIRELSELDDYENLVPELFSNKSLAEFLMREDCSTFYKFMNMRELRDHFIYLHDRLLDLRKNRKTAANHRKIVELLSAEGGSSVEYLRNLLEKTGNVRS